MVHMKTKFNVGDMVRVKSKKELIDISELTLLAGISYNS